jgi:uncharacterized Tic20 family protein
MSDVVKSRSRVTATPETTSEERTWAALAHASTLLTMLVSLMTLGVGGLLFVFVPFIIYLVYKDKSDYVAYHAAQSFALQIVGTVGLFVAVLAGTIVLILLWVIAGVLSIILVGLLLIPVALVLTVAFALLIVAAPFVIGGFSIAATIETGGGKDYRYPYLGDWVLDWVSRGSAPAAPTV